MTTSLLARRPFGLRAHDDDDDVDTSQGSLFGIGEVLFVPERPPFERQAAPSTAAAFTALVPEVSVPAISEVEADVPDRARSGAVALAGPTLDDAITRAWEGLVAGLSASCPLCHHALEPTSDDGISGHCTSCGVTLD